MFQFKIVLLITCLEVYCGFAYQCPKSVPFSTMPGLSRVSLPISNAFIHFKINNEFLIESNGRTRYVCVEFTPEIYALRNETINNYNDNLTHVENGGDYKEHIIAHSLGGSNNPLNVFSLNQNCKSKLLNSSAEQKLAALLNEHSRITYVAELEYTYNVTDARPTRINALYLDENENILGSVRMINSPPNTPCKIVDLEKKKRKSIWNSRSTKNKRSLTVSSTHPKISTNTINCMDGCRRRECWSKVEDRDKKCRSHFHSVHANSLCVGDWCYCCTYY